MDFPRDRNQYVLAASADGAAIHKAKHVNPATGEEVFVGIKIIDVNKIEDICTLLLEVYKAQTINHDNIFKIHCSFRSEGQLWLVMSPPGIPIRTIMQADFRQGLPEKAVTFILIETLKAIHYMHEKNEICGKIGAGCVSVCLGDEYRIKISISSITCQDHPSSNLINPGFINDYGVGEDKATDILMLGFLAMELFYGKIPSSDELGVLVANEFGKKFRVFSCFRGETRRIPPKALAEVMAACLRRDPAARPTTTELMESRLFQTEFYGKQSLKKLLNEKS